MSEHERRNSIALDDAYFYCRLLEEKAERPTLFKLCNAIRTLDLALYDYEGRPAPVRLTAEAWQRVRDSLFDILLSSFAGYFIIYSPAGPPIEPGTTWPDRGTIEFYPEKASRKNDSYSGRIEHLSQCVLMPLRWAFAEGRQQMTATDFIGTAKEPPLDVEEAGAAQALLFKLYQVCEEQACKGKKQAHRKWWQLYWEANTCPNKRQKHELQKQMVALQSIWGRPAERSY